MENVELLKRSRNQLLSLHKSLVDFERTRYEAFNGKVTSGQFLNVLLEDEGLSWLRRFSTFIVDVVPSPQVTSTGDPIDQPCSSA